jgi:alpha-1,2-mannosyltransferase
MLPLLSALVSAFACYLLPSASRLNDLRVYVLGGDVASHLGNLYQVATSAGYRFTYPPFAAVIFTPLTLCPLRVAEVIWLLLSAAAYLLVIHQLARGWPRAAAVTLSVALAWVIPVRNDFRFGQIEILLVLAVLVDLRCQTRSKGVLLGIAAAMKLTPGLFILYYFVSRQYRAGVTALASLAACTAVAFAALPQQSWRYVTDIAFDYRRYGVVDSVGNQSTINSLHRLGLSGLTLSLVTVAVGLGVVGVALYRTRRAGSRDDAVFVAAVVGCASALVSPISWTHHFIWLLPAVAVFLKSERRSRLAWWLMIPIGAAALYISPLLRFAPLALASLLTVVRASWPQHYARWSICCSVNEAAAREEG